ncbi:hypothetical protein QBC40DRAFT_322519, partial [Triangularia verruculosa]
MARGNAPGARGGSSHGGRGGFRGRGRGRRYVGAAYAASLAAVPESPESALRDITNVSSPAVSPYDLRRNPAEARPGNYWFSLVSGSIILKFFNRSLDSPECYEFQTVNSSEANPAGVSFAIIHNDDQPLWKDQHVIYTNSRLHLLPHYAENKATLVSQHQEATEEQKANRLMRAITENIQFGRYGLEDGPDMEVFDMYDEFATSMVVPGDWQKKKYEKPNLVGCNNTASVKYTPGSHAPLAVFETVPGDDRVEYISWFRIAEIELFAANSAALVKNFHKMGLVGSIDSEWATLKLVKVLPGDPQYRHNPQWKKTEARQYKLGRKDEHTRAAESRVSEEESLAGERERIPDERLAVSDEALANEETGTVVVEDELEEELVLVEKVRQLTVEERVKALLEQAEEHFGACAKEAVAEIVEEEK